LAHFNPIATSLHTYNSDCQFKYDFLLQNWS
jgi:hypothetical protein